MPRSYGPSLSALCLLFACTGHWHTGGAEDETEENLRCGEGPYPAESEIRRLTARQYQRAIEDLYGGAIRASANYPGPGLARGQKYSSEAGLADVSLQDVREIMLAAEDVAVEVADHAEDLLACSSGDACAEQYLDVYGRRAFRRSLRQDERALLMSTYAAAIDDGASFEDAIAMMTSQLLQLPQFLYIVEDAAPDARLLSGTELASRLSFTLWDSIPDDELLDLAESGELEDREILLEQARRLLGSPRADLALARFFREWTGTRELTSADRSVEQHPFWSEAFAGSMNESYDRFVVASAREGTMRDLFRSPDVFVDANMASFFGIDPPAEPWARVSLGAERGGGITTQPALLASLTSATRYVYRGRFVINDLLCQPLGAPPANAESRADEVTTIENPTSRQQADQIAASPDCGSCHTRINPLGLAFERFDELGRYDPNDPQGRPIETAGRAEIAGQTFVFDDHVDLVDQLAADPHVAQCVARQIFRFTMAYERSEDDRCAVRAVEDALVEGDIEEALLAMVGSDAFRMRLER
jgi:hypothetical protein